VEPDPGAGLPDTRTNLEQFHPERSYLGTREFSAPQVVSEKREQAVRESVKQQAELVREEAVTAQVIGVELELEFLDPILCITSEHVDLIVEPLGRQMDVGDHKPLIRTLVHVLNLGHHPAVAIPRVRPVTKGGKEPLLFPGFSELLFGLAKDLSGLVLQPVIGNETDRIMKDVLMNFPG
jgi:hypothetical protein